MGIRHLLAFMVLFLGTVIGVPAQQLTNSQIIDTLSRADQSEKVVQTALDYRIKAKQAYHLNAMHRQGIPDTILVYTIKHRVQLSDTLRQQLQTYQEKGYSEEILIQALADQPKYQQKTTPPEKSVDHDYSNYTYRLSVHGGMSYNANWGTLDRIGIGSTPYFGLSAEYRWQPRLTLGVVLHYTAPELYDVSKKTLIKENTSYNNYDLTFNFAPIQGGVIRMWSLAPFISYNLFPERLIQPFARVAPEIMVAIGTNIQAYNKNKEEVEQLVTFPTTAQYGLHSTLGAHLHLGQDWGVTASSGYRVFGLSPHFTQSSWMFFHYVTFTASVFYKF
jgi:hypothetical protein